MSDFINVAFKKSLPRHVHRCLAEDYPHPVIASAQVPTTDPILVDFLASDFPKKQDEQLSKNSGICYCIVFSNSQPLSELDTQEMKGTKSELIPVNIVYTGWNAINYISTLRRENIIKKALPKSRENLAKILKPVTKQDSVGEGTHLFGNDAMDQVLKWITALESLESQWIKQTQRCRNKTARKARTQSMGGRPGRSNWRLYNGNQAERKVFQRQRNGHKGPIRSQNTPTSQDQTASNKSPSCCGTTLQLSDCLERDRSWGLGNESDRSRLPLRIPQNSTHQIELPDFIPLSSAGQCDGPGSTWPPRKGSDRMVLGLGWFLQPGLHSIKERQRVATNQKFESPKSVSQYSALQNVYSPRYFEARRLYGQDRSERRILQRQNSPQTQEISEVSLERNFLPALPLV